MKGVSRSGLPLSANVDGELCRRQIDSNNEQRVEAQS
jgi:hypothetical protein